MPTQVAQEEEEVLVGVSPGGRYQREIFNMLGITERLIESMDIDTWTEGMNQLKNSYAPTEFKVKRRSFMIQGYPTVQIGDSQLRLGSVTLESAKTIVEVASGNLVTVRESDDAPGSYELQTISTIENEAFRALYGDAFLQIELGATGDVSVVVSSLRTMMGYYRDFRENPRRKDVLRAAIKSNMRKSIAQNQPKSKPTQWDKKQIEAFDTYFKNVRKGLKVEAEPFSAIDILPTGTKASRFWGIEPEVVHADGVKTPRSWERKSDGSLRGLQHECLPSNSGARPGTDPASVPRTDHDEDCESRQEEEGCSCGECFLDCSCGFVDEVRPAGQTTQTAEWNSSPMRSYHSKGLEYLCNEIEYRDTNNSAGIHVHVNAGDLDPYQVVQVGLIYTALEPLFMAEYKRVARNYCKEITTAELVSRFKQLGTVKTMGGKYNIRSTFSSDRYYTVNIQALSSHGTLEFRAMGARYNYDFLIRWAHFLREIVNIAAANVPQKVWRNVRTFKDLVLLMAKYGKETPMPSWATDSYDPSSVVAKLGTENRRAPHEERIGDVRTVFDDYTGDTLFR